MVTISIIIPVYNVEIYLRKCLDSLVNQSFKDIEVILVDDGSTDGSGEICDEYSSKYAFIKVIHKLNAGVSCARNTGLELASGKYIGFVDPDDYVDMKMYEKLYNALIENDADISMCRECAFRDGSKIEVIEAGPYKVEDGSMFFGHFLDDWRGPYTWVWNKLFKREVIDSIFFSEKYTVMEDIKFIVDICSNVRKSVDIGERLYFYRQRDTSAMGGKSERNLLDYISVSIYEFEKMSGLFGNKFDKNHLIKVLSQLRQIKKEANKSGYSEVEKKAKEAWKYLYLKNKKMVPLYRIKLQILMLI